MQNIKLLSTNKLTSLISKRPGEVKLGEKIRLLQSSQNIYEQIRNLDVKYVIFGIKEDIGIRANYGLAGAKNTWKEFLSSFLNIQYNKFIQAENILILGHLNFKDLYEQIDFSSNDIKNLRHKTSLIDEVVTALVYNIIKSHKIPIIIGGGHNNAYGAIKGCALALNKKINVLNVDAHADFRALEGRHSGNGFSYAFKEGFLKKYYAYGLHENYISDYFLKSVKSNSKNIMFLSFEDILKNKKLVETDTVFRFIEKFIGQRQFGLEIDCDAIINIESSAMSPTGFTIEHIRNLIYRFGSATNVNYLHFAEAIANNQKSNNAKLLTYLVTDFIKANS